jgi:hypothetical protein
LSLFDRHVWVRVVYVCASKRVDSFVWNKIKAGRRFRIYASVSSAFKLWWTETHSELKHMNGQNLFLYLFVTRGALTKSEYKDINTSLEEPV